MFPIRDTIPSRSFPVVNTILIAVNALVFIWEVTLSPEELQSLFYVLGLVPARYSHPEWAAMAGLNPHNYWPFLANAFLHSGWLHFVGNMWTLYIFGDNVEDRMGRARYLAFYLLCGLAASGTHFGLNLESTLPALGASGAISGVMAAYMFMFPRSRIVFLFPLLFIPLFFDLPAFFYIGIWFIAQLISGTSILFQQQSGAGIAFWAHIGGFVMGLLTYRFFAVKPPYERPHHRPYRDEEPLD